MAAGATSLHPVALDVDDDVVADVERVGRHVLFADEPRPVPRLAEDVHDVPLGVAEPVAAMGQAEHAAGVWALPGEQGGTRPGAHRRGAEGLTEQHALVGKVLDVRCRHGVAVGLDVAAGVVRVQVDDVGTCHSNRTPYAVN